MAKESGLGDNLYVGGNDLSGDVGSVERIGGGPALLEVTGIDKSAVERLGGKRDGGIDFTAFFNDAAGQAHAVLSALPTADVMVSYCRGTTLGDEGASMIAKQVNYDPTRGEDGSLTINIGALANGFGLEYGIQHTAGKRTDSSATDGTGVEDYKQASTSFGLQAYIHCFAFTGTSFTAKLQESDDDASSDAYADVTGGGFAAISAAGTTERIVTGAALTVEQWLRVVTTGTFSNAVFAVMVARNYTAPAF